jgi:hypothetical protein
VVALVDLRRDCDVVAAVDGSICMTTVSGARCGAGRVVLVVDTRAFVLERDTGGSGMYVGHASDTLSIELIRRVFF